MSFFGLNLLDSVMVEWLEICVVLIHQCVAVSLSWTIYLIFVLPGFNLTLLCLLDINVFNIMHWWGLSSSLIFHKCTWYKHVGPGNIKDECDPQVFNR